MAEASYLRIAAQIRERIADGRLRPGEKVPSTRQITQEWGVAMATATKVIATLRDEGLVDPRPGAGTVVRPAPGGPAEPVARTPPREQELGRDRIVRAAMAVADAEGLAAVTMRRVATELGVATMSLYRHVSTKDNLTVLMADTAVAERPFPPRPAPWRASLETIARHLWTVCRRHPWVAESLSMTRPQVAPNLMNYSEWAFTVLHEMGLPAQDVLYVHINLFGHVRGLAMALSEETQAHQDTGLTMEEWQENNEAAFRAVAASGRYPTMEYLVAQDVDYDIDELFEYGLRLLLDGIEQRFP
jgi:DNA-binding transcriptional regulator YhcF (GntR family)